MVLIDTSLWIEFFRKRDPFDLESVVDLEDVVTCLPVVQEVLQGFRDEGAYRIGKEALLGMPVLESPLRFEVFEHAVDLFRTARRGGVTIRKLKRGRRRTATGAPRLTAR